MFETYQTCDGGKVLMGNNEAYKVMGIGSAKIKMFDGVVKELHQVRYVPDLKRNLISLGMLDQLGCVFKAENETLKVINHSMVVIKGVRKNGLYVLRWICCYWFG